MPLGTGSWELVQHDLLCSGQGSCTEQQAQPSLQMPVNELAK